MPINNRIPENELVLPSLFLMEVSEGHITTEELIPKLRKIMKPSGEDLDILANRTDDKFSQKVRNLKAHNTFERLVTPSIRTAYTTCRLKANHI